MNGSDWLAEHLVKTLERRREEGAGRRVATDDNERVWRWYEAMMLASTTSGGAGGRKAVLMVSAIEAHRPDDIGPGSSSSAAINARRLVRRDPERWLLTEGYAVVDDEMSHVVNHAWVTDRGSGSVIDPTWPEKLMDPSYQGPVAYLGYRFHPDFALAHAFSPKKEHAGILASEETRDWAALRRGFELDMEGLVVGYA